MEKYEKLNEIVARWCQCAQCPNLVKTRKDIVIGDGNPDAQIVIVGEAPGENENELGVPFVGRSGEFLDQLMINTSVIPELQAMSNTGKYDMAFARQLLQQGRIDPTGNGVQLDSMFYMNVLGCRPENEEHKDRPPHKDEISNCMPRVLEMLYAIDPVIIIACGGVALQSLLGKKASITLVHGHLYNMVFEGPEVQFNYTVLPILHPSFMLRLDGEFRRDDSHGARTYAHVLKAMHIVDEFNWRHYGVPVPHDRPKTKIKAAI